MDQVLEQLSHAGLLFAAIFVITAIGIAVVRRFRGSTTDDRQYGSEMISNFSELHSEGGLSDEEFRTIKAKLASELRVEVKR